MEPLSPDIQEQWGAAARYPGYEVSDQGNVRRSALFDSAGRLVFDPVIVARNRGGSPKYHQIRYWEVSLRIGEKKRKNVKVHHLVCETFHGPRPPGMESCHGPGGPLDDRAVNLRWDTHAANMADTVLHGTNYWANQTECINGHDITNPDNCYDTAQGRRKCKTCQKARSQARHERLKDDPAYQADKVRYGKERYARVKDDPAYKAAAYERNRRYICSGNAPRLLLRRGRAARFGRAARSGNDPERQDAV